MPRAPLVRPETRDGEPKLYHAGLPRYTANFSRDSLTYGLLADDLGALRAQVDQSAAHQGRRADPERGEEPGKIHHELPGARIRDLWTTYDACDTAALFIIALDRLVRRGVRGALRRHRESLERAVGYIREHLYDGVFHEDPAQCGAERFALKVTYWKDSELNVGGREREPTYPIAYALPHFQCKAALRCAGRLLRSRELERVAETMARRGCETFWRGDHFAVAVQEDGTLVDPPSSDSLHALLFLEPAEIPPGDARAVVEYSEQLVTPFGYLPSVPQATGVDGYHTRWVWVHEQALLHAAARRHGLERADEVAQRIVPALARGFPELVDPASGEPGGQTTQLWSIGASVYFERLRVAHALARLEAGGVSASRDTGKEDSDATGAGGS